MIGDGPKAFISALLQTNPVDRLGCFREGGQGVKDHEWFPSNRLDFAKLEAFHLRAIPPKGQIAVDTSNFDQYDQDGLLAILRPTSRRTCSPSSLTSGSDDTKWSRPVCAD